MTVRLVRAIAMLVGLAGAPSLSLMGCLDSLEPDVGPPLREICVGEDSDPGTHVRFEADIMDGIFGRPEINCFRCHTPDGSNPIGVQIGGFDMSSYTTLRSGGVNSGTDIVITGEPCESLLVQKVSPAPPFGSRMPLSGPPFLSVTDQQLIHDWIAEGAPSN